MCSIGWWENSGSTHLLGSLGNMLTFVAVLQFVISRKLGTHSSFLKGVSEWGRHVLEALTGH